MSIMGYGHAHQISQGFDLSSILSKIWVKFSPPIS